VLGDAHDGAPNVQAVSARAGPTRRFALGAVFVYQRAVLHHYQRGGALRQGLTPFLCAARRLMTRPRLTAARRRRPAR
jgi:hypothetical protein